MKSLFRPTLIAVLCSLLALGHGPAYLHVATCDGHRATVDDDSESATTELAISELTGCCSHSCAAHTCSADTRHTSSPVTHASDSAPDTEHPTHDSEHCVVCQSLALPGGAVTLPTTLDFSAMLDERCVAFQPSSPMADARGPFQPRGPPACASWHHA